MRILVVNDDGYDAIGIKKLALLAKRFGEVTVVAPEYQCSAMSHRLTIFEPLTVKEQESIEDIPVYSVSGTPADCVRAALHNICREKPDIVFSGINNGYNTGYDIVYSGTVGAAMEALMFNVPAIAFSADYESDFELIDAYIGEITKKLLDMPLPRNEIWNVNFPNIPVSECKGIKWNCTPAQVEFHNDAYKESLDAEGNLMLALKGEARNVPDEGSDLDACIKGYIAVGRTMHAIMKP